MNTFNWNQKEISQLSGKGLTFLDIRDIAKDNIIRIKKTYGKIYGISTPYTTGGYGMSINTEIFYKCMMYKERMGYKIFNFPVLDIAIKPLRIEWCKENNTNHCFPIISIIYRGIFETLEFESISRTEIWESSSGCRDENDIFIELGIKVFEFPNYIFKIFLQDLGLETLDIKKAVNQ